MILSKLTIKSWFASVALCLLATLAATHVEAGVGAFKLETVAWQGSASHTQSHTFSIAATGESVILHHFFWMNGTANTSTIEVWWKPGSVLTASPSTAGWTKIGTTASFAAARSTTSNEEIDLDLDFVIPKGKEFSFLISSPAFTHFASSSATLTISDAQITLDRRGYSGSYNATYGGTQTRQTQFTGGVSYDLAGTTWTGAASSDWNDPNNWDISVPNAELGAVIPDAASTPNDPILPTTMATLPSIELDPSAILYGGNGIITLTEKWENDAGFFIPENSLVVWGGTEDFEVVTGGRTIGNVHIQNTAGDVFIRDEFSALNAGTLMVDPGANVYFEGDTISFTATNITNAGLFHFGLDGGGLVATLQSITTSGQDIGNVRVEVNDALDEVEFLGAFTTNDYALRGAGNVRHASNVYTHGAFLFEMDGTATIDGTLGEPHFISVGVVDTSALQGAAIVAGNGTLTVGGGVHLDSFRHLGSSSISLGANAVGAEYLAIDSTLEFASPSPTAIIGLNLTPFVAQNTLFNSAAPITIAPTAQASRTSFGTLTVTGTGNVSIPGLDRALCPDGFNFNSNCTLTFNAIDFGANSTITGAGLIRRIASGPNLATQAGPGILSLSGTTSLDLPTNVRVEDLRWIDTATGGTVTIDTLLVRGTGATTVQTGTRPLQANTVTVGSPFGTEIGMQLVVDGAIQAGNVEIRGGSALLLKQGSLIDQSKATAAPSIFGSGLFETEGGPNKAKIMGSTTANRRSTFNITHSTPLNTGAVAFDGIILENFGVDGAPYALRIAANVNVQSFNGVEMRGIGRVDAAVILSTNNTATIFKSLYLDGQAIANIDATGSSGQRIEVKEAKPTSGNLYGAPFEIDPNGVLYWENPPVVDVISNPILPNALAENPYTFQLQAVGGNQPLSWALANQPSFLTINPTTGELTGTPGREHIGTHVFVVLTYDDSHPSLTANKVLTLVVDSLTEVGVTIVTPNTLINGKIGQSYRYALAAAGGSGGGFTWHLINPNALPKGLFLNSETGEIYGTPSPEAAGVYNVAMRVEDAQGNSAVKSFAITIHTEFSDPALIANSLSDGPGGGCALGTNQTLWLLALLGLLSLAVLLRRQEA